VSPKREFVGRGVGYVLALLGLLVAGPVRAQGQGVGTLTGTVVDASTHAPVPDVVVTATSPQLQGEQVAVTDSTGLYRIPQLPPGSYSLRFEKEQYKPYSRGGIGLDADRTLRLNVELLPESVTLTGQEVVVVGKAPVIDVGTTQTGLTVTSTFSQNVPISPAAANNGGIRSFAGLALAAPQVAGDLFGISIAGTTSPENSYLIDGLSFSDTGFGVNNKNGFTGSGGTAGSDFSVEFVDQMNVITGGYMPEYGRTTGGVMSVTSKSGGNEFHGSVFATWTPGFMAQTAAAAAAPGGGTSIIGEASKLYNAGDIGFTLGGYIIKDKLWFFVGFNPSQFKTQVIRSVSPFDLDAGGNALATQTNIPSATKNYYQTQTNYSYIGKLTYLINSDHRISLSVAGSPDSYTTPYGFIGGNGDYVSQSWAGNDNTLDVILRLNSSFLEKKLLLDITVGWHHQNNNVTAIDGSTFSQGDANIPAVTQLATLNLNQFGTEPSINNPQLAAICNNTNIATGNGATFGDNACPVGAYTQGGPTQLIRNVTEDRIQAKAVLTYFLNALGHQTLKAGADVEYISYENKIGYAGEDGYFGVGNANGPASGQAYLDFRTIGYLSGPDQPVFLPFQDQKPTALLPGAFFQDSWNLFDKVTLNLGVRFDSEYMYNQDGNLALALNNQWAPRLGIIWDPTYQGKSKVYASYAFYYEAVPLDLADRSLIGNEFISAFHVNCQNPGVTGQRCSNLPANLVGGGGGPNQYWGAIGADKELIDPNIGPQKTDEFQVGAEYEIFPNARLGVNYTHRGLSRLIEDFSNNSAASYVLGNPGQGVGINFVNPARIYNGYTVSLTKTFADHWQAQASYTYVTLNGNLDGLFTPGQGQLDPNINATYDLPQFLINGFGPLAADTQHRVKFYGSYQFIFTPTIGLTLGGAYNGHSGAPISALGGDPLYGGDTVFIIPRGSYGRLPWVHQVDLHATIDISLGQDMRLQFGADVFNVIGSQQTTAVDQSWVNPANTAVAAIPNGSVASLQHLTSPNGNALCTTTPCPATFPPGTVSVLNTNFGHPSQFQAPRNFRLLARFTF
jgi:Carboxypeptidase regulatory-like domain/TonB dependent receptor